MDGWAVFELVRTTNQTNRNNLNINSFLRSGIETLNNLYILYKVCPIDPWFCICIIILRSIIYNIVLYCIVERAANKNVRTINHSKTRRQLLMLLLLLFFVPVVQSSQSSFSFVAQQ